jgi:hypothetical protein
MDAERFRGTFGGPTAAMGRPGPAILGVRKKDETVRVSISGGRKGSPGDFGIPDEALTPGLGYFRPPSSPSRKEVGINPGPVAPVRS